jgi:uncharacterized protein YndB with AHSA1/START domain
VKIHGIWAAAIMLMQCVDSEAAASADDKILAAHGRRIVATTEVAAPINDVWQAWTTKKGLEGFFAPEALIEPRVGGGLSVHFYPKRAAGFRGAENMTILSFEPPARLSFTWNAPRDYPHARSQRAVVTVYLVERSPGRTAVTLVHDHFGAGYDWNETIAYFGPAWQGSVLPRLRQSLESGPIDWSKIDWSKTE